MGDLRLTRNAVLVMQSARTLALQSGSTVLGTEHLLLALSQGSTRAAKWLAVASPTTVSLARAFVGGPALRQSVACLESPSVLRAKDIARLLCRGEPVPTEYLLLGVLFAGLDARNAAFALVDNAAAVAEDLAAALRVNRSDLPAPRVAAFGLVWTDGAGVECDHGVPRPTRGHAEYHVDCVVGGRVAATHWVGPQLLCGPSAGRFSASELHDLVAAKIDTVVCLQTSYTEYGCADYRPALSKFSGGAMRFLHAPIPDFGTRSDTALLALVECLAAEIRAGHRLYIHCYGGHGRTGTVVVNLLSVLLGISAAEAMRLMQESHAVVNCGSCALSRGALEDEKQEMQTQKLEPAMGRMHKIHAQ